MNLNSNHAIFNPKLREGEALKSKKILTIFRKEKEILEYTFHEGKSIKD